MAKRPLPCPTVLRQLLRYEPETGELFWKRRSACIAGVGKMAPRSVKRWNTRYAGSPALTAVNPRTGYRAGSLFDTALYAHRAAWALTHGFWPKGQIDHINGVRGDNRLVNLRDVPHSENTKNSSIRTDNSSGVVGVGWVKRLSKWRASIFADGEHKHLGMFVTLEDAAAARKIAELEYGFHRNHGKS